VIKTFIVDDEIDAISSIKIILESYCNNIEIVGSATSISEALIKIPELKPNLLILDIEMPFGSGFDLLEKLIYTDFETIFVTAYNNYAIKAFKYSAVDYILKPIDIDEIKAAISRCQVKITDKNKLTNYKILLENVKSNLPYKIAINSFDSIIYVNYSDIVRIEADGSYTSIILLNNKKILVSKTLKEFQELLLDRNIFRPHNSHLINLDHVATYHLKDGGYIEMRDGSIVPLSRRKKEEFIEIMTNFSK